jgi:hypothetical protein
VCVVSKLRRILHEELVGEGTDADAVECYGGLRGVAGNAHSCAQGHKYDMCLCKHI